MYLKVRSAEMRAHFFSSNRAIVGRDLVDLPFKAGKVIVATSDEKFRRVGRNSDIDLARDFRLRISVQVNANGAAIAHEHDVIPCPQFDFCRAAQELVAPVAVEENQPPGRRGSATDAKMIAVG